MKGLTKNEVVRTALAWVLLFGASAACTFSGGDTAPGSSDFGVLNATISGVVRVGSTGLSGARVSTDRGEYSTTSDANGNYSLAVAGDKTYNVIAASNGYVTVVSQGNRISVGQSKTVNLTFSTLLGAGEKTYVGSSQCKLCHATQYNRWSSAPHRYGISAPGDSPGILAGPLAQFTAGYDLVNTTDFSTYGANAPRLGKSGETYTITIGSVVYPVTYTMGYQWKQRYLTKIGEAHYILPIQYNVSTGLWVAYNASDWYSGTTPKLTSQASTESDVYKKISWERRCMGCHSVTGILSLSFSASTTSGISQHRAEWVEKGIGCEDCHGPASAHVWANGSLGPAATPYITNPSKLTRDRQMDVCGSCHSRGLSVGTLGAQTGDTYTLEYYYDGTRTFRPGDTLVANYTDAGGYWTDSYAENRVSKQHHQQWNDLYQSGHTAPNAADTSVTCGSCHDVHGPVGHGRQLRLSALDNSLCLTCHGPTGSANQRFTTDAAITAHTGDSHTSYAPGTTGAGRCITCHMPYTAKSAVNYDIRSHVFRVVRPHETRRFYNASASEQIPNSCQQACHNGTAGLGTNFGTGTAGALLAAQQYDSHVLRPALVQPDTGYGVVRGTISVAGATSFPDTFGVWVSADYTERSVATNRTGSYYLLLDAPGTYTIRASKAGWDSAVTETVTVTVNSSQTINMTLPVGAGGGAYRPARCNTCHGGIWGSEWRNSGFQGARLSSAEDISDELSAGHGLMVNSPAGGCGTKCHEAHGAERYLRNSDTVSSPPARGPASRRPQTCQVCHKPHSDPDDDNFNLWAYSATAIDTGFFHANSISFPAMYEARTCVMCHSARRAPASNGSGIRTSGSDSIPNGTPHVGNNAEGFFGHRLGYDTSLASTGASINFDSIVGFVPFNSTHTDTNWGQTYSYQAYVYDNGTPRLVSNGGAPVVRQNVRFTCNSCHMFRQGPGTYGSGTNAAHVGGHSFKPDIRSCGVCHDPSYVSINPYTNTLKAGSGDAGYWGTDTWGVSSSGRLLGFDRPVAALPHQRNTNGDAVSNDYDGNGRAEGAHHEAEHLFYKVMALMTSGTYNGETSGIALGTGADSFGHTFTGSNPYWKFVQPRAANNQVTNNEMRAAWNLVFFEHDEKNLGVHNLRFTIETLRTTWRALGRYKTANAAWEPPGDDY